LGASGRKTNLSDAKADAEVAYRGLGPKWVDTGTSVEEARRWLERQYPEDKCSFCGKLPFEFEAAFGGHRCTICGDCVRKYFSMLNNNEPDDVA
jgi:hypothetical protein